MKNNGLRQMRLARGLSLAGLAEELGGLVTRQALHNYERGLSRPSPEVARRLTRVFGLDPSLLNGRRERPIHCVPAGYRHYAGITQKEKKRIEAAMLQALEARLRVQYLLYPAAGGRMPPAISVRDAVQAEAAAAEIRRRWDLGRGPIASMTGLLEEKFIHVIEMETDDRFDGVAVTIRDAKEKSVGAAVVNRVGVCGERERLSLSHELGHLVLDVRGGDEERTVFRFAGAFLAPAEALYARLGRKRSCLQAEELLILKRHFGISLQALLFRLYHLDIINRSYFDWWYRELSALGWRKREPEEIPRERPQWLRQAVLHAVSEGLLTGRDIRRIFAASPERETVSGFLDRAAFKKQGRAERRRRILEATGGRLQP
ncbi:MAG TPA: XRE family transcriptional regulator [bacterium]|uniref:Helix-turn-helix protein n=1 Tax=candidate division TA06 bacterium ADurb.Bin417 TaxID=1852828 RepID=A0A1V5MJU9_UNCT6|nr:MAG: helix-turn-helix protein [candidate division TA06 bacterium ADurb.Bin417]HNS48346.1 XRE family transcriptional regulator [bacterium]